MPLPLVRPLPIDEIVPPAGAMPRPMPIDEIVPPAGAVVTKQPFMNQDSLSAKDIPAWIVTVKDQPFGEAGIRRSLEEVALRATRGMYSAEVGAWVTRVLRDAGGPDTPIDRARAILAAVRKEFVYVPDPVMGERMVDAKWLVNGVYGGGDCDDLTILQMSATLAALGAAGIRCGVVGHSYDADKQISHVLGALYYRGKWYYMDPSVKETEAPFGEYAMVPTRERVYAVPVENDKPKVICDQKACLKGPRAISFPDMNEARFIGVSGVPRRAGLSGAGEREMALGVSYQKPEEDAEMPPEAAEAWRAYMSQLEADLKEGAASISEMLSNVTAAAADLDLQFPLPDGPKKEWWHIHRSDVAMIEKVAALASQAADILHQGVTGERRLVAIKETGDLGLELLKTDDFKFDALDTDFFSLAQIFGMVPKTVPVSASDRLALEQGLSGPGKRHLLGEVEIDTLVGLGFDPITIVIVLIAAAYVAIAFGVATNLKTICTMIVSLLQTIVAHMTKSKVMECMETAKKSGEDPSMCLEASKVVDQGVVETNRSRTEMMNAAAQADLQAMKWAVGILGVVTVLAAVGAGTYIYQQEKKARSR